jgi:hypothetical protein
MITDNFCFYLQNRLIQTSQTGGQQYSDTSPLVFPGHSYVLPFCVKNNKIANNSTTTKAGEIIRT